MLLMGIWSSLHRQLSWFADQTGKWFDAIMRPWLQYQIRICFRNISWDNLSNLCRAWQPGGFVFLDPPGFNHHIIESHHGRSKQPLWLTDWWFGIWNIFPYIGKNHPNWLIFFRGVETTNQLIIEDALSMFTGFTTAYPPLKLERQIQITLRPWLHTLSYTQNHIQPITSRIHYSWHSWYVYIYIYLYINISCISMVFPSFYGFPWNRAFFHCDILGRSSPRRRRCVRRPTSPRARRSASDAARFGRSGEDGQGGRAHGQIYGMFHRIQGKPIVKSRFKNWKQWNGFRDKNGCLGLGTYWKD